MQGTADAVRGTVEAFVGEYGPTIESQLTQFGPTLLAAATEYGPQLATLEAGAEGTLGAVADPANRPTFEAQATNAVATAQALLEESQAQRDLPVYTANDGKVTTRVEEMGVGQSRVAPMHNEFEAHNWLFAGQAGQAVTISVSSDADPAARLIGPDGTELIQQDDINPGTDNGVRITYVLPQDGLYTVRVTLGNTGEYTLIII